MRFLEDIAYTIADNPRLLVPLGIVGLWRWSMWLAKRIPAAFYRPITNDFTCSATIVSAVYREDPGIFQQAIISWIANKPDRIIVVIDSADCDCINVAKAFREVEIVCDLTPGKRPKLVRGIDAATSEIVVLTDSDVIWSADVLPKLKMPFKDPQMGGVSARPYMFPSNRTAPTVWERLADFYLDARFSTEVPATTRWGQAVSCLSGRTSAYRTTLLQGLREPFLNETFNGILCISGDDKRYTMLVLETGFKTWHQLNAIIYSTFSPSFSGFVKQRVRWARNSFRSDFRALSQRWLWSHHYLAFVLVDKQLGLITQLSSPVFFVVSAWLGRWVVCISLIVWWHVSRSLKVYTHLRRKPGEILLLPIFLVMSFMNTLIRIYALFTVNKQGWLTRA